MIFLETAITFVQIEMKPSNLDQNVLIRKLQLSRAENSFKSNRECKMNEAGLQNIKIL